MMWSDVPCKEFPGAKDANGYGKKYIGTPSPRRPAYQQAHRWTYEQAYGPIDDPNLLVCHRCDNPPCVELTHLFLGTHSDNVADMIAKGRASWQRITHCPQGHPYDDENTLSRGGNKRRCAQCHRDIEKRRRLSKPGPRRKDMTDEEIATIRGLLAAGRRHKEIAAIVGFSPGSVSNVAQGRRLPKSEQIKRKRRRAASS